jgi:hypothetical protein
LGDEGEEIDSQPETRVSACVPMADADARGLKRRLGVAEKTVQIKKERLEEAQLEYEEEHRTFTCFSKRLEERWTLCLIMPLPDDTIHMSGQA